MYEAKYQKYITKSEARFAEPDEILNVTKLAFGHRWGTPASGIPLLAKNGKVYVDNEDNHTFVIGPTGCKKSRVTVYTTVASIVEAGESAIVNDPKGEIYRKTSQRARELGADVILLNFRKPSSSHGWNPLSQAQRFYKAGKVDEALQCVSDFAESVVAPAQSKTVDNYWGDCSKIFLIALVLMLMDSVTPEYFNIKTLIPFCYESAQRILAEVIQDMDQSSTTVFGIRTVTDLEAERTKSCIYSTLLSILRPFAQNKNLTDMMCDDALNIEQIGQKQTIVYVVYPDEKENLNFLVNLFLTQCYETLVCVAADSFGDKLPVRVNFVLDEFSNLVPINNFANRISEARSKNIRYFLFVQSYGQLKQKYSDCSETIISNCNNWVCFSSKEMEFLHKLSQICGKEVDYNGIEHDLISPFAMQYFEKKMESSEVLIVKQGKCPFVTALPDFDYIPISKAYEPTAISYVTINRETKSVTPEQWVAKIAGDVFKFPYPKVKECA